MLAETLAPEGVISFPFKRSWASEKAILPMSSNTSGTTQST